ncbi:MAG: 50S ribosomal protein L25/general stress protein Ctc [Ketobacteraceae bacterium]|nr:50S ribosomal protein L25/general stress protein Ctc [Ketobacteraceae bacterium]
MSDEFTLTAELREAQGKGASRRLRRLEGKVPAILYGADKEPTPISLMANEVVKASANEAFYSHVLTLILEGKEEKAVIKDMQRHPSKGFVMHADFQRIDATHKLTMQVPIHFINEDKCHGAKLQGGIINHQMSEVEIQCLAKDLPEYLEVDMTELKVGDTLHLSDIKLPAGVEIPFLQLGADHDQPIVSVNAPKGSSEDEAAEGEGQDASSED